MMEKEKTLEELKKDFDFAKKAYEEAKEKQAKIEAEKEAARIAKLNAEKETRYKEVISAYENFEELRNNFVKDYGRFTFHKTNGDLSNFLLDFFA